MSNLKELDKINPFPNGGNSCDDVAANSKAPKELRQPLIGRFLKDCTNLNTNGNSDGSVRGLIRDSDSMRDAHFTREGAKNSSSTIDNSLLHVLDYEKESKPRVPLEFTADDAHGKESRALSALKRIERFLVSADKRPKIGKTSNSKEDNSADELNGSGDADGAKSRYGFLEKIMDANKLSPSDPRYDPRTLYISLNSLARMKPIERQYWNIKKQFFNHVVFFNKGKFFELMEFDADVGQRELGLNFTARAGMKMCGIPVTSYIQAATKLLNRGYSICRVAQVELNVEERSGQELMDRQVEYIVTPGTITDPMLLEDASSKYLLCIVQDAGCIGICILDASNAKFWINEFECDSSFVGRLRTLLFQFRPEEVLYERFGIEEWTMKLLRLYCAQNAKFTDRLGEDCWREGDVVQMLSKDLKWWKLGTHDPRGGAIRELEPLSDAGNVECGDWGSGGVSSHQSRCETEKTVIDKVWPDALKSLKNNKMAMRALGICMNYLQELKISYLIASGSFYILDIDGDHHASGDNRRHLLLDSKALAHLHVLENEEHSIKGTILELLDYTMTSFGKRLLREWVSHPLSSIDEIGARQNSVEFLMKKDDVRTTMENSLKSLPDLERLLSKAIAYRIDLQLFSKLVDGLRIVAEMFQALGDQVKALKADRSNRFLYLISLANYELQSLEFHPNSCRDESNSRLLYPCDERAATVVEELDSLRRDLVICKDEILPRAGFDAAYDEVMMRIDGYEREMKALVRWYSEKYFGGSSEVQLVDVGNSRCLLEVPKSLLRNYPEPDEFVENCKRTTSKFKRYSVAKILEIVPKIEVAEFELKKIRRNIFKKFLDFFNGNFGKWKVVVSIAGECDCLLSLSNGSLISPERRCRPVFYEDGRCQGGEIGESRCPASIGGFDHCHSFICIKDVVHPCLMSENTNFVPNDVAIGYMPEFLDEGDEYGKVLFLLMGPNMGGKSTVLRQICVAIILAQIGCWVYAKSFHATCFDRIFTRIGASDDILEGKSTFLVELEETGFILNNATSKSFVILDELGRGTSTFDGYALAYSTMEYLALKKCCTIFSTHYHMLAKEVSANPNLAQSIDIYHMDAFLDEFHHQTPKIIFLYKMIKTTTSPPKSHGLAIASMANLPEWVIKRASEKSSSFEKNQSKIHASILARNSAIAKLKNLIQNLQMHIRKIERSSKK